MKFEIRESFHWGNSETENNAYLMQYARDNDLISDQPDEGPVYILPNGKFVNLLWFDIDVHGVFFDLFQEENRLTYDDFMGEAEVNLGWIRANSGTSAEDNRSYIDITVKPTNEQYESIEIYFDFLQSIDNNGVMVFCGRQQKTYSFEEYLSEDIVKKIKRYFSSGTLYEDFDETDTVIDDNNINEYIKKYVLPKSDKELLELSFVKPSTSFSIGAMFILPNGDLIDVREWANYVGISKEMMTHTDFGVILCDAVFSRLDNTYTTYDACGDLLFDLTIERGWIRLNAGMSEADDRCYIVLSNKNGKKPTNAQYDALMGWLDYLQANGKKSVMVVIECTLQDKTYTFDDYTSDDVIKRIKRYYSSGTLYESLADYDEPITDQNIDEYTTEYILPKTTEEILRQSNIKPVSKLSQGPLFILPNGQVINVPSYADRTDITSQKMTHGDLGMLICDAMFKVTNKTYDYDYEGGLLDYLIDDKGWIRVNTGTSLVENRCYCVLPRLGAFRVTNEQYGTLLRWFDLCQELNKPSVAVMNSNAEDRQEYNLDEHTSDDIIKKIKRYYTTGTLYEDIDTVELSNKYDSEGNQLTKEQAEFFKNSKVRDNQGRLLVCYHSTNADFNEFDTDTSWDGFGFHFGTKKAAEDRGGSIIKKVYLNIKNPLKIDKDLQYWDAFSFISYLYEHRELLRDIKVKNWEFIRASYNDDLEYNDFDSAWYNSEFGEEIREALYNSKYDGIIYTNFAEDAGSTSYMAFYPNQIKSIDNKNPTSSANINESLSRLEDHILITDYPKDIVNYLREHKDKPYRLLYDKKLDVYCIWDADTFIHYDVLLKLKEHGYFNNQKVIETMKKAGYADFKPTDLNFLIQNYIDIGIDGLYDEVEEEYVEIEPYLLYAVYQPKESDFKLGDDGYNKEYKGEFGNLYTRGQDLEDFEFYQVWSSQGLKENYLDDEEKFFDYRTASVSGNQIFDTTTLGGYSGVMDVITDAKYMRDNKGLVGSIVQMSPNEYFDWCGKIFGNDRNTQKLRISREEDTIEHLKQVIQTYNRRFPMTYLRLTKDNKGQEGRHRMYVAGELFGWDTKFPVLVVQDVDNIIYPNDLILKESLDSSVVSSQKIIDYINGYNPHLLSEEPFKGPCYILPNGQFLKSTGSIHYDIFSDFVTEEEIADDTSEIMTTAEDLWGWIRCNDGSTAKEPQTYTVLNNSSKQPYNAIIKWLDMISKYRMSVDIWVDGGNKCHEFYFEESPVDDIVKDIKRYYSSGNSYLFESIDESYALDFKATDSPYTVKDILKNADIEYRIVYDGLIDTYFLGNADDNLHSKLVVKGYQDGWYNSIMDEIEDQVEFFGNGQITIDDYFEDGSYLENSDAVLLKFLPKDHEVTLTDRFDGYSIAYEYDFGSILARNREFEDVELYKVLGKPRNQKVLPELD